MAVELVVYTNTRVIIVNTNLSNSESDLSFFSFFVVKEKERIFVSKIIVDCWEEKTKKKNPTYLKP